VLLLPQVPALAPRVLVLLQRALYDNDDEVRAGWGGVGLRRAQGVGCARSRRALRTPRHVWRRRRPRSDDPHQPLSWRALPTPSLHTPSAHTLSTHTHTQVRDRAMLHLTQLQGGAGGAAAISPPLDANLAAFEAALKGYLDADDTQQPFDVVRFVCVCVCSCTRSSRLTWCVVCVCVCVRVRVRVMRACVLSTTARRCMVVAVFWTCMLEASYSQQSHTHSAHTHTHTHTHAHPTRTSSRLCPRRRPPARAPHTRQRPAASSQRRRRPQRVAAPVALAAAQQAQAALAVLAALAACGTAAWALLRPPLRSTRR
jgi:hypothetical protein